MSRKRSLRGTLLVAVAAMTPLVLLALISPARPAQARATAGGRVITSAAVARAPHSPIQHVVVLYLENHSFDSLLGFWCDDNPGRCPAGGMPRRVKLSNGAVVTPSVGPDVVPSINHSVGSQRHAMNCPSSGGTCKMNGWQKLAHGTCDSAVGYQCISGYQPSQEPNLAALATQFAISDRTFSMADSPSWGGHLYAVAGSLDGFTGNNPTPAHGVRTGIGWGCDSDRVASWKAPGSSTTRFIPSCVPDPALPLPNGGAFRRTPAAYLPTIMDRLDQAGLPWRIYGADCADESVDASGLETCRSSPHPRRVFSAYIWSICPSFAECLYGQRQDAPDDLFSYDASHGKLPAFSLVTPSDAVDSWHNGFSVTTGDNWLGKIVSAVMNSPEWDSTAMFITWDDCGCFYDQVPPGINPDGTRQGPRVPLVIVSPWVRQGYTDDTPATFASILAFTEHTFGLMPLTANDAQAYDFSGAFDFHQRPVAPVRMVTRPQPPGDHIQWAEANQDS